MPGASKQTRRVKTLSANWVAGEDGNDGRFEVLLITEDDERHVVAPSPASTVALVALARADTVLLWDPDGRTLIAANVVGRMPWSDEDEKESAQ
jgi:predicted nucleic acid-binding Zn ribbon protein